MLSERFIMALWTNPPRPFVGDTGRSGELRPEDAGVRTSDAADGASPFRGSNLWEEDNGTGEPRPPVVDTEDMLEYLFPTLLVPNIELALDGERDLSSPVS